MYSMNREYYLLLCCVLIGLFCCYLPIAQASEQEDVLSELSLESLLRLTVTSASGVEESYRDAPASMVIITATDIKHRGYTSLDEIIVDLPGFDSSVTNGNGGVTAYQRGYRTPFTQRTLMLINGIVDNHLWTHEATFTKTYPLSNIDRIEVLYGPAGAIYGPNAFLGIINIVTKNASKYLNNESKLDLKFELGSFKTQSIDLTAAGQYDAFSYNVSAKYYRSNEAGIDDYAPWGYLSNELLSSRDIWGPVVYDVALASQCNLDACPHLSDNKPYGNFLDRSRDWGILADISYQDITFGLIAWEMKEGYGPYYPSDRAQAASFWNRSSLQYYLKHEGKFNDELKIKSLALYRVSRIWGDWAESFPGSPALSGADALSWVSISDWNSINYSWLFKQDYEYSYSTNLQLSGGLKYENKRLTKAYDLCSYWADAYCSSITPESAGLGVATNTELSINIQPDTLSKMPAENMVSTIDIGGYMQGIWQLTDWRINAGVRYDHNSIYGATVNPRASAIYYWSDFTTVKLLYGKAFQEPAPLQLWGGWSGRAANPELKPERAQNIELILMLQRDNWLHELSIFSAHYDHVIKEEAENAGKRTSYGLEYRGSFQFANFINGAADITSHVSYTFTKSHSSVDYDATIGQWVGAGIETCQQIEELNELSYDACADLDVDTGDIAPHKINANFNLPLGESWNLNVQANWQASKTLYMRNPLRAEHKKNDSFTVINANISYDFSPYRLALKIKNVFNQRYYHSGVEGAESGDDFSQRSLGWRNSLIPQTYRNFMLTFSMAF
jgi:outer membrane receptor for ferrienterochelin and colicins